MKRIRCALGTVVAIFVVLVAAIGSAHAERKMLVLIDASGSMLLPRNGVSGETFIEAAVRVAATRVNEQRTTAAVSVAVYSFSGSSDALIPHTNGYVHYSLALNAIDCLIPPAEPIPGLNCDSYPPIDVRPENLTPLAGALCDAADNLQNATVPSDIRILSLLSDGLENDTRREPCQGGPGEWNGTSYQPSSSWQARVFSRYSGSRIEPHVDLFVLRLPPGAQAPTMREGGLAPGASSFIGSGGSNSAIDPLEQFFSLFAQVNGGRIDIVYNDAPLPVAGDLDGDQCVDYNDAIFVARSFGPIVPPIDGRADLNSDRVVNFADYEIQRARSTQTCGPSPYRSRLPALCFGGRRITLDREAIESGDGTILALGACEVVIKDSLVVSGRNAITIIGAASVKIDNSIIVGDNAISIRGATVLSAANTVFHGGKDVRGAFRYIDRGGNIWE